MDGGAEASADADKTGNKTPMRESNRQRIKASRKNTCEKKVGKKDKKLKKGKKAGKSPVDDEESRQRKASPCNSASPKRATSISSEGKDSPIRRKREQAGRAKGASSDDGTHSRLESSPKNVEATKRSQASHKNRCEKMVGKTSKKLKKGNKALKTPAHLEKRRQTKKAASSSSEGNEHPTRRKGKRTAGRASGSSPDGRTNSVLESPPKNEEARGKVSVEATKQAATLMDGTRNSDYTPPPKRERSIRAAEKQARTADGADGDARRHSERRRSGSSRGHGRRRSGRSCEDGLGRESVEATACRRRRRKSSSNASSRPGRASSGRRRSRRSRSPRRGTGGDGRRGLDTVVEKYAAMGEDELMKLGPTRLVECFKLLILGRLLLLPTTHMARCGTPTPRRWGSC
ncbi:unnamed protein product [Prorocentrum cordatum]|uniref:Uncharacterized protein n=1 Tax=Prorocentrum cordatum TaxID=2364126 RepID=A0ABN9QLR4_9DINO|nr:unnamed protein product [Polarella glacialis]